MSTLFKLRSWFVWLPLVTFFNYQFILRRSFGTIEGEIARSFGTDATDFGILGALTYFGYALMQLPIGVTLDAYGPRVIATLFSALCAGGSYLFATSSNVLFVGVGRLLIGMGASAAFLSTSKAIRLWFPEGKFSFVVGITVTIGLLGAVLGGEPVAYFLKKTEWQNIMLTMAIIGVSISVFIFSLVRSPEKHKEERKKKTHIIKDLIKLLKTSHLGLIAIYGMLMGAPLYGFADTFGVKYFVQVYGWSKTDAASAGSFMYFGMCFGSLILPYVAEKNSSYKQMIILSALGMVVTLGTVIGFHPSMFMIRACLFVTGFFCAYQVLVFSLVASETPPHLSGTVIGFVNMTNMLGGGLCLPLMGWLLDLNWDGKLVDGVRFYSSDAFLISSMSMIIGLLLAATGFYFLTLSDKRKSNNKSS